MGSYNARGGAPLNDILMLDTDDDIRQNEGFKNVSLGNVLSAAYQDKAVSFISDQHQVQPRPHAHFLSLLICFPSV